jgi:hypothetical protein
MSTSYSVQVVASLLTGSTTDWTKTTAVTGSHTVEFISVISLANGAADTSLTLGSLTDPKVLVVIGATGITFKLGAAGTDSIGADQVAAICDEGTGLGITEILLSNSDSVTHAVTVYAAE